jgi:hypothetical protein
MASAGAGAPIYMELRRFTFRQQQICYFFSVGHQRIFIWRRVMNLGISICTMTIGGIAAGNVLADVTASPAVASSVSDKETTSRVGMVLAKHPDFGVQYSVSTRHNVVHLDGILATGLMKRTAEALAMDITGVKQVIDLAGIAK